MSEPRTSSQPGGAPTPPADPAREATRGRSYWAIVWGQFKKNLPARVGVVMVALMFALAVFAPFLANNYPYYWRTPKEGLTFPLVRSLSDLDLVLLMASALLALVPVTRRVLDASGWRFWWLHPVRRAVAVNLLVLAVGGGLLAGLRSAPARIFMEKTVIVDGQPERVRVERNFKKEARETPGAEHLFPPIPYSPSDIDVASKNLDPSGRHVLGTDRVGRSVAARVVYGARTSLAVGFIAVGISVVIGILFGGVSAYLGGSVDLLMQRVVEMFICFPKLFLILFIVAMYGSRLWLIMVAIGLTGWTGVARFVRAEVLKVKTLDYVTAARALGFRRLRIILLHAVPNSVGPVIVSATFGIAGAIMAEAGLSFLGLGDPDHPSWGLLLSQAQSVANEHPQLLIVPGTTIFFAVLGYNLVGEGLRDAIDPRLKM